MTAIRRRMITAFLVVVFLAAATGSASATTPVKWLSGE